MAARPPTLHQPVALLLAMILLLPPLSTTAKAVAAQPAELRCIPPGAATVAVRGCSWRQHMPHVECSKFPPDAPAPGRAKLSLDAGSGNSIDSRPAFCVTLTLFQRNSCDTCFESLEFRNFTVGWAVIGPRCKERDCPIEVYILESVAALSPLKYNSTSTEFWNFTSPVFREDENFFITLAFNAITMRYTRCSISLTNIYNLGKTSIEKLVLYNNDNINTDLKLGMMPKLKQLAIANSSILDFPEDAHVLMPALERLDLRDNRLTSIPAAIASMRKLEELNMRGARLRRLAGQLPPLPCLRELSLRNTGLCCLHQEQDAFRGVPNLVLLDISHNQLTSLGEALRGLNQLQYLDVSRNQLTEYPQLWIQDCTEGLLSFAFNHLRTLPDCNSFCQSSKVLLLDVENNQISSWDGSPDMLRCISGLHLSNNTVSELSATMLRTLDAVTEVQLAHNPLRCAGCPLVRLQQWLVGTAVRVLGAPGGGSAGQALRCAAPRNVAGMSVAAVPADPASCRPPPPPAGAGLALGLSLAGAAALGTAAVAAACYRYRFEVAYGAHLLRMRMRASRSRRRGKDVSGNPFEFDAFILYSSNDRPWVVGTLVPLLENGPQRYRLCLHERDFQLGTVIVQNISRSMDHSRHTIVVLSKSFLSSRWCLWEMDLANHRTLDPSQREFIILLELEPLERSALPRHLRFLMDTRTYVEWHQAGDVQYEEQAFRRLKRALGASCFTCSDVSRC
ncbi:toll-like receptor 2 [Schistocerca cancellata]|uniref:toll-like receptor 2 n=1 Tax=Schistocerca cancellata TaxID=274614 RepID=UPI00211949F5|nr:toll-like receptor 2 [Schistocerca cancellata]